MRRPQGWADHLRGKGFRLTVLTLGLVAVGLQHVELSRLLPTPEAEVDLLAEARGLFPAAAKLGEGTPRGYPVLDASGAPLGALFDARPHVGDLSGFGGAVPLVIGLDLADRVVGLRLLPNAETPSFIERLEEEGFFASWDGLTPAEAQPVDGVTGATMTSAAVARLVEISLAALTSAPPPPRGLDWRWWGRELLALAFIGLALLRFARPRRFKGWRLGMLVGSALILGVLQGYMLSLALGFGWITRGLSPALYPSLVLMAILAVVVPLVTSRDFYCAHLCPFGAAQALAREALPHRDKAPAALLRAAAWTRPAALATITCLLMLGASLDLTALEPFSAFMLRSASLGALLLAGAALALSLFAPRAWCRLLCPTGLLLELLRRKPRPAHALRKEPAR